ncbi:MAG: hypothetical protein KAI35_04480 [Desulfobulbaceae bacterium]|nr:hypothetical protein [Desulfobulbaceae bacterium]
MLKFFRKIKNLRFKKLGTKDAALFLINRKLSAMGSNENFGKLTDLKLDRPTKTISFEVSRDEQVHSIAIKGYRFVIHNGRSCLSWAKVECRGPSQSNYLKFFKGLDRIEIPRRYLSLLEVIL